MKVVARFGQPPRRLSLAATLQLLFGGGMSQVGWLLLAIGMVFTWLFLPASELSSWWRFRGDMTHVEGTVIRCEQTNFSTGGSQRGGDDTPVYANTYRFPGGSGVSYASGKCVAAGGTVDVEYASANPAISRIVGMRAKPVGSGVFLVLIFPAIGAALIAGAMRSGVQQACVLCDGKLAAGSLVDKRATGTRINDRTVFEMEFEFSGEDGAKHRATVRTTRPEDLEDDARENMLYDPRFPSKAVLLDALPGRFATDDNGDVVSGSPFGLVASLFLPAIFVAVNAIAIRIWFG